MADIKNPNISWRNRLMPFMKNRLVPGLVVVYQVIALIALIIILINAFVFFRTPFTGTLIEHTMVFTTAESAGPSSWDAKSKGLFWGHQLLTIDGKKIGSVKEFNETLSSYEVGEVVKLEVVNLLSDDHRPFTVPITLQSFPVFDQVALMVIPFFIGLVYLGCGLWVFSLRRYDATGQIFSTFSASVAVATAGLFEVSTTSRMTVLWTFCLAMIGGTMIHLALLFPEKVGFIKRYPFLGWLSYIPTVILVALAYPTLFNFEDPLAYVLPWRLEYIYIGLAVIFFLGMGIFS